MTISFSAAVTPGGRFQETSGSRRQPYVAVASIDLRPPRAEVEVLLYGAWQSTAPDDHADGAPLIWRDGVWELDLSAPPMARPNDVVFLVALIEHFDDEPRVFKNSIRNAAITAADDLVHLASQTRVARWIDALNKSIDAANGGPNLTSVVVTCSPPIPHRQ